MSGVIATLDDYGKPAWIVAMVAGFIVFWPIGLGILAYLLWSGRMGCNKSWRGRWHNPENSERRGFGFYGPGTRTSGNAAFDEYRDETLRRLEEEQKEFTTFLERLRMAKDKAEFDQFMSDRRNRPASPEPGNGGPATVPPTA